MIKSVMLPEVGEGITEVEISDVLVSAGSKISADDVIMVLETDKASMEIPSGVSGTVTDVLIKSGTMISPGAELIRVDVQEDAGEAAAPEESRPVVSETVSEPPAEKKAEAPPSEPPEPSEPSPSPGKSILAGPSVRRYARELGADLSRIAGSGKNGRITKDDVQSFVKLRLSEPALVGISPAQPEIDFSKWGKVESTPLNKIRRLTASRMQSSWNTAPQVTQFDQTDITELEALRQRFKTDITDNPVRVTLLPFLMKAAVACLKEFPDFNASLDSSGSNLIHKQYYHIGVAVDTPQGLMVPVIRDVDQKGIQTISRELAEISGRARNRKILPDELQGGTFSISSLGGIGGTQFTPIVNLPEVAIMGISRSRTEPVFSDGQFEPRLVLPFSLSYDHRVIDGAAAVRFTTRFGNILSSLPRMMWELSD